MGKIYKTYEHLCYTALDWAWKEGKRIDDERIKEQKQQHHKEINECIQFNYGYANNYWNKHFNELLEEAYENFKVD